MRRPGLSRSWASRTAAGLLALSLLQPCPASGQRPVGREAAMGLRFPQLRFVPPRVQRHDLPSGVPVFLMEDHSLPLVTFFARFKGGYALLPREDYAAATALSALLRSGGTTLLPPDSVDRLLDFYALQMTVGGGGESNFSSVNTLTKYLRPALELWTDILRTPRFDSMEVEVWRGRQAESIRRRKDNPGLLAFSEFNRIMFGDHPIGWEMDEEDLEPERLSTATLLEVHRRIFCPENLIMGVVGDVAWDEVGPLLERVTRQWPSCSEPLQGVQAPRIREGPAVFLIPRELTQSTIVMAEPGGIAQGNNPDYFASRIGNSILGAGGLSSRLGTRVRTEKGYAYSVSSLWTTPFGYEGIVGAVTQTRSESTIATARLILQTIEEMRTSAPGLDEVERAIDQIVNGFVFNFQDPAQIVSREMFYLAEGIPTNWLEQYIRGVQRVEPSAVQRVFRRYVDPGRMVILILGDPDEFDLPPEVLGEVQIWDVGGPEDLSGRPRGGRRSPR